MNIDLYILGSTGSIGETTLKVIKKDRKKFRVKLLTANNNITKLYNQALEFNVKKVVVFNKKKFQKYKKKFSHKKIKVFFSIKDALKYNKKKVLITINGISGFEGLEPSLNIIKYTKILAIANKESIICGWKFLKSKLIKHNTKFIPLDSEHFSIWSLLKNENISDIKKIYLTASGGPFLNKKLKDIKNIDPSLALKHPNWNMGKKISIDSATMMNKIFEIIEAQKIFEFKPNKFEILIHPQSYIHAIIHFSTGLTKFLAHETTMEIPIANVLHQNSKYTHVKTKFKFENLNGINFIKPDIKKFPLLKILNYNFNNTYFEIILVSINDYLVKEYLNNKISYSTMYIIMLKLLKNRYFTKYYNTRPNNINEIKSMVNNVNLYLKNYLNKYEFVN